MLLIDFSSNITDPDNILLAYKDINESDTEWKTMSIDLQTLCLLVQNFGGLTFRMTVPPLSIDNGTSNNECLINYCGSNIKIGVRYRNYSREMLHQIMKSKTIIQYIFNT